MSSFKFFMLFLKWLFESREVNSSQQHETSVTFETSDHETSDHETSDVFYIQQTLLRLSVVMNFLVKTTQYRTPLQVVLWFVVLFVYFGGRFVE